MTLRVRSLVTGAALVVILLAISAAINVAVVRVSETRVTTSRLDEAAVDSRALATSLIDQETGQRGYVLTGDESFLAPYRTGLEEFTAVAERIRRNPAVDDRLERFLDATVDDVERWRAVGATPEIAARRSGDERLAVELVSSGAGRDAFDDVRSSVTRLQRGIDARLDAARERDTASLRLLRTISIIGPLALLLILVGTAYLTRRWVVDPVLEVRSSMRQVAAGDLTASIVGRGPPEVAALGRDAEQMRRRIVAELDAARAATEALDQHSPAVAGLRRELSSPTTWRTDRLMLAGRLQAAEGVLAGDWWSPHRRPDGSTAVVIADVSGHGTEAGLMALRFRHRLGAVLDTSLPLGEAFQIAAAGLTMRPDMFLTCLCLCVDDEREQVEWVNAGHPPGLLISGEPGSVTQRLAPTGPLVSALGGTWTQERAAFRRGDAIVIYTDGFLEARDEQGEEYGEDRLVQTALSVHRRGAEAVVEECFDAVHRFSHGERRDDLTCVVVQSLTTGARAGAAPGTRTGRE